MLKILEEKLAEGDHFEIDVRTTDRREFKGLKVIRIGDNFLECAVTPDLDIILFNAAAIVSLTIW
jgi:hypothetical protein